MQSISHLKIAIEKALVNTDLATMVGHGTPDLRTGETVIAISERSPSVAAVTPYIGYKVIDTEPMAQDDPTLRHYESLVFIYVVSGSSATTTRLADYVQSLFTDAPCNHVGRWYYDISDNCIVNKFTKFISRLRFGREGQNFFNNDTNTWAEAVEIRIWWTDVGCAGCTTLPPVEASRTEVGDIICDC